MRRLIIFTLSQLFIIQVSGQNTVSFHPPLKIPMYLAGNFGEIRSDHFHSGIDIKTQGTIGHHVYSIESGYVSRIKVQANGYGKSIYITHPNGFTSVYGHLDGYREDIAAFVKNLQYKRRSHMVDLYLNREDFPMKKGDFIAYSGNSGSSSGPHLHFEVRSSANQHPTNVLKYDFKIADQVAPQFWSVNIYPIDSKSHVNGAGKKLLIPVVKDNGMYTVPYGTKVNASGELGVSVEVFDYLNGASNRCGVYTLELYVDDRLIYEHIMDEFAFSETRYINAHTDYEERITRGTKAHRLHRLSNDRLRIYKHLVQDGVVMITESRSYDLLIVATDVAGNRSELRFKIWGDGQNRVEEAQNPIFVKHMKYGEPNEFTNQEVDVQIPANALYQDMEFCYEETEPALGSLTPFYHISKEEVPVHLPYTLSINFPSTSSIPGDKLLLITINEDGEIESAGGQYRDGYVEASLRNFGKYAIGIDTIAPEIIPLNGRVTGDLTGRTSLKFTILDDLSGIQSYEGYIDNQWVLFEYDLKNDLLVYTFDKEHITNQGEHDLELYVSDSKGNANLFHTTFTW